MLERILFSSNLRADCPYGCLEIVTQPNDSINIWFQNGKVFRSFLSSVSPHYPINLGAVSKLDGLSQEISVKVGKRDLLNKLPGKRARIHFLNSGVQFLRWKLGI
jgi:hypothetical protein